MEQSRRHPFAVPYEEVEAALDTYVDAVIASLASEFMTLPKGEGFVEYSVFEQGYEGLRRTSDNFSRLDPHAWVAVAKQCPIALCVLRAMLGFTPPEWAYAATQRSGMEITQGYIRSLDRGIRLQPLDHLPDSTTCADVVEALVETACQLLQEGAPPVEEDELHRLEKADTAEGLSSLQAAGRLGIPYPMLLYERFLGRPFATHRDSVSEVIGDSVEAAIEDILCEAGVPYRKTRRAEKISGFDQAPDFIVPNEFNPRVLIEAKVTQDDGTARDKVTRIQHLAQIAAESPQPHTEVVACISGRGFGVRRNDMVKLLEATRGKVFTLATLEWLVPYTALAEFATDGTEDERHQ